MSEPDPHERAERQEQRPALFGWWGVVLAWMAWGVINVLRIAAMPEMSWAEALTYGFPDAFLWAAVTPLLVFVSRRFEVRGEKRFRHLAILGLISIGGMLLHCAVDAALAATPQWIGGGEGIWTFVFVKLLRYELHTRLLICMLVIGFAHYQIYARRHAEQRSEADRLAAQLSEAKLGRLRSQLRPHFLFNALNSVSASMEQSPEVGRRVVRRLGELLRASLKADQEPWITLEQELDLARAYLEIEQARFEDRLQFRIEVQDQALSWSVPALLLQPLVENAVTRGIAPKLDGGTVAVYARIVRDRLVVDVEDDGVGLGPSAESHSADGSGIGLANTRDRIATLYGDRARLRLEGRREGGVSVQLQLPGRPAERRAA